ncbi:MAG: hypothetical protein P8098_03360 [Candidatus Thiodiazotropha sp.]
MSLNGWSLHSLSGMTAPLTSEQLSIPSGGLAVVRYTGQPMAPILEGSTLRVYIQQPMAFRMDADGCTLQSPNGPVDGVTWGTPPPSDNQSLSTGAPLRPGFGVLRRGESLYRSDDVMFRLPGARPPLKTNWLGSANWAYRRGEAATPGVPNKLPAPLAILPGNGARLASAFHLSASGLAWADKVTFQIAKDAGFGNMVMNRTVDTPTVVAPKLSPGHYYYRVRGQGTQPGTWSKASTFEVLEVGGDETGSGGAGGAGDIIAEHIIGISHIHQRKDTRMVCLDGCPAQGRFAWDRPHPAGILEGGHNESNCSNACLAMVASLAGCTLSQDRIAFYILEELPDSGEFINSPWRDLGHDEGIMVDSILPALDWIYGNPDTRAREREYHGLDLFDDNDRADMDSIREFIDDGRPVLRAQPFHVVLVDGYRILRRPAPETGELHLVHVIDPETSEGGRWETPESGAHWTSYLFPPTTGEPMRCDERSLQMDSDSDGLIDFDETQRFHTDPNNSDSDNDRLPDKIDMLGYLFNPDGSYFKRQRDLDGDGNAKEKDADNDRRRNNGAGDGCEDINADGYFAGAGTETDNFNPDDEFDVMAPGCLRGFIRVTSEMTLPGGISGTLQVSEEIRLRPNRPVGEEDYAYRHEWELTGSAGPIAIVGSTITSTSEGQARGQASIRIEIDAQGHYRMVTDTRPRIGYYTITTTGTGAGPRTKREDFHYALADHHFDYVSPDTPRSVRNQLERWGGQDTIPVPGSQYGITGTTRRTWQIWLGSP